MNPPRTLGPPKPPPQDTVAPHSHQGRGCCWGLQGGSQPRRRHPWVWGILGGWSRVRINAGGVPEPLKPPQSPQIPPLTCRAGGGAAHGAARQRARARGGGVSCEGGGVSVQGGGASPRGPAPPAGFVDHGVGDIHGGGRGGLGRHRNAPGGDRGGAGEGGDTCPGHLSGSPVPWGEHSPEQGGAQSPTSDSVLVQGGLGRQGVTCGPPKWGLPELPRPPNPLGVPPLAAGSLLSLPLSGARKCRGRPRAPTPPRMPAAPSAPGWAPPDLGVLLSPAPRGPG